MGTRSIAVFLLSIGLFVVVVPNGLSWAQQSEIEMPNTLVIVGVAEINDEGKLVLNLGAGAPATVKTTMVNQTYTVVVPISKKKDDDEKEGGEPEKQFRTETRTRRVPITRMVRKELTTHVLADLKFFSLSGDEIPVDEAKEHFGAKQPIVAIANGTAVPDFFAHLFQEEVMVVELPGSFAANGIRPPLPAGARIRAVPVPAPAIPKKE